MSVCPSCCQPRLTDTPRASSKVHKPRLWGGLSVLLVAPAEWRWQHKEDGTAWVWVATLPIPRGGCWGRAEAEQERGRHRGWGQTLSSALGGARWGSGAQHRCPQPHTQVSSGAHTHLPCVWLHYTLTRVCLDTSWPQPGSEMVLMPTHTTGASSPGSLHCQHAIASGPAAVPALCLDSGFHGAGWGPGGLQPVVLVPSPATLAQGTGQRLRPGVGASCRQESPVPVGGRWSSLGHGCAEGRKARRRVAEARAGGAALAPVLFTLEREDRRCLGGHT